MADIKYDNPTKSNFFASELKVGNSLNSDISAINMYKLVNIIRLGIKTPTILFLKIIWRIKAIIKPIAIGLITIPDEVQ